MIYLSEHLHWEDERIQQFCFLRKSEGNYSVKIHAYDIRIQVLATDQTHTCTG